MKNMLVLVNQRRYIFGFSVLIVLALAAMLVLIANAGTPLSLAGYFDFSYGAALKDGEGEPTAEKPESKLWWNDGFWWGVLYNNDAGEYRIYRLNWGEQTWEDTGVLVDDREDAHTDVLWDETAGKLYVVSNFSKSNPTHTSVVAERGRFYRFSYDQAAEIYSLDGGFPKTVNEDKTETLVVEKDSTGRMWVTFVGYDPDPSIDLFRYTVQVNYATTDAAVWNTQFRVPVPGTENYVEVDDISSIIAFEDDGGPKIGVMWSNQLDGNFYFATHDDGEAPDAGWNLETISSSIAGFPSNFVPNDHINLAKNAAGQVFAAIKTENPDANDPSVGLIARDTDGTYSFHEFSDVASNDTRPIVVYNQSENKVYLFVTSNEIGGRICYKAASVTSPLSNMQFPAGNCLDGPVQDGAPFFIADEGSDLANNATSTKQIVNATTGLAVLASDDDNGYVYLHNVMGDPPPVITSRSPVRNATAVPLESVVKATFSKSMNQATFSGNFTVSDSGGTIAGSFSYQDLTRTATFTPASALDPTTVYTVTVTTALEDSDGLGLFENETWTFTSGEVTTPVTPIVQFDQANYSVNEGAGTATITVNLSEATTVPVSVDYHTSDDTAIASSDYVQASGTLNFAEGETSKTFNVAITEDNLDEASETVRLTLTNPVNAVFADEMTEAHALLTIEDNDEPVSVHFGAAEFVAAETAGTAEVVIVLSAPSGQTVSVDYATATGGTATPGADYTAVGATTLVFGPGETSKSFFVTIKDDSEVEGNETVNLTLSNADDATLGSPSTAVLTITDDESAAATVQFADATYNVSEGGAVVNVEVTLSNVVAQAVSVNYATADGTAEAGQDYTADSGTLTFAPGETSKIISIPILDDGIGEDIESFTVTLSSPVGAALGTQIVATVEISDNDRIFLPIVFGDN